MSSTGPIFNKLKQEWPLAAVMRAVPNMAGN